MTGRDPSQTSGEEPDDLAPAPPVSARPHSGSGALRQLSSELSTSGELDLNLWRQDSKRLAPGVPQGPLDTGDSDEAHNATSAALADFVAQSLGSTNLAPFEGDGVIENETHPHPHGESLEAVLGRVHSGPVRAEVGPPLERLRLESFSNAPEPLPLEPPEDRAMPLELSASSTKGWLIAASAIAIVGLSLVLGVKLRTRPERDVMAFATMSASDGRAPLEDSVAPPRSPRGRAVQEAREARPSHGTPSQAPTPRVGGTPALEPEVARSPIPATSPAPSPAAELESPVADASVAALPTTDTLAPIAAVEPPDVAAPATSEAVSPPQEPLEAAPPTEPVVPPPPARADLASLQGWEQVSVLCREHDGVAARQAFRALRGAVSRTRAVVACRPFGIDVTAMVEGPTASEYLAQAENAYQAKDYNSAYDLARDSLRLETHTEALVLMGRAACGLHDRKKVKRVLGLLKRADAEALSEDCRTQGMKIRIP